MLEISKKKGLRRVSWLSGFQHTFSVPTLWTSWQIALGAFQFANNFQIWTPTQKKQCNKWITWKNVFVEYFCCKIHLQTRFLWKKVFPSPTQKSSPKNRTSKLPETSPHNKIYSKPPPHQTTTTPQHLEGLKNAFGITRFGTGKEMCPIATQKPGFLDWLVGPVSQKLGQLV